MMDRAEIANRFAYHPATIVTGPLHDSVRAQMHRTADFLIDTCPDGRHLSLALTALQESMMWANAAIACDTK